MLAPTLYLTQSLTLALTLTLILTQTQNLTQTLTPNDNLWSNKLESINEQMSHERSFFALLSSL